MLSSFLRRRALRTATLVAVLAFTAVSVPLEVAASAAPVVTAAVRADGTATVSWTFPDDPSRVNFAVWTTDATSSTAQFWGVQRAMPTASSTLVTGLLPGRSYTFTVRSSSSGATAGLSASFAVKVGAGPCTGVAAPCVAVDTALVRGTVRHIGQGFLHGVTSQTPMSLLAPLASMAWRIAPLDPARYSAARSAGDSITVLLSDGWLINNWSGSHVVRNPWDDWATYSNTIKWIVQWHVSNGMVPDYWEIQNEPDDARYYNPATPPTRASVLEQLRVAYDAIKSVLPTAKVAGPSLGNAYVESGSLVDFASALGDFADHGLRYDAITWHEIGAGGLPADFEAGARSIPEHVAWIRELLAEHPSLGSPPLIVGEYGAGFAQGVPGAEVGYLAALERLGVSMAMHSCWPMRASDGSLVDTCFDSRGLLDGLVGLDGGTTPAWWVHRDYAAAAGTGVYADGTDRTLAAFATVAGGGEIDVLVGRDTGCSPQIGMWCPSGTSVPGPLAPVVSVKLRAGLPSRFKVVVDRIPFQAGSLATPKTTTVATNLRALNGQVSFSLPTLAAGDAAFVHVIPA